MMDTSKLKYVVGKAEKDAPAVIRFFGSVDQCTSRDFVSEFLWLQEGVKPSKIVVLINSDGGSVLYGMSVFSVIRSCPIETECVVEGIAASMGSVIWAAGDNLFMHDYSLLMVHNPFSLCVCEDSGASEKRMVDAFKSQLAMIYRKRFGMKKDDVEKMMNGDGEADGTFFTAEQAVDAGILDATHVLKTSKAMKEQASVKICGLSDAAAIRDAMSSVAASIEIDKILDEVLGIHNKENKSKTKEMGEQANQGMSAVFALFGLSEDAQLSDVSAKIVEMQKTAEELKKVKASYNELEIKFKGKETELANVSNELASVKASLEEYKKAEKQALETKINAMVEAAVKSGKIQEASKDSWIKMAHNDLATVENVLNSIQGRENIGEQIAGEESNVHHMREAMTDVEKEVQAKVEATVGKDFQFKKF